jgi:uroporphyrinogen decarboxylase
VPDPTVELRYVIDAVSEIRRALDNSVPLIGFSGSPWTLACYMVEGGASRRLPHIKTMLYDRPDLLHHMLGVTAQAVTDYLNAQIEAGAQAVMIFDSWGGCCRPTAYREFSLAYMQRIVAGLKREHDGQRVPGHRVHQGRRPVAGSDCRHRLRCVGLDWTTDIGEARRRWSVAQGGAAGQKSIRSAAVRSFGAAAQKATRQGLPRRQKSVSGG